jgi:hypothetical protein
MKIKRPWPPKTLTLPCVSSSLGTWIRLTSSGIIHRQSGTDGENAGAAGGAVEAAEQIPMLPTGTWGRRRRRRHRGLQRQIEGVFLRHPDDVRLTAYRGSSDVRMPSLVAYSAASSHEEAETMQPKRCGLAGAARRVRGDRARTRGAFTPSSRKRIRGTILSRICIPAERPISLGQIAGRGCRSIFYPRKHK